MNSPVSLTSTFNCPGLAGWYDPGSQGNGQPPTIDRMSAALQSSRVVHSAAGRDFACVTTGDVLKYGKRGFAAITGRLYWASDDLQMVSDTQGDAAALVRAYEVDGKKFIEGLKGAFAFILIDPDSDLCLLGVDRLGQIPLYYAQTDTGFIFGTSAQSVLAHSSLQLKLDTQGLYNYVYFHMVPSPDSIYRSLHKLPAGHCLHAQGTDSTVKAYWKPDFSTKTRDFESARLQLPKLLKQCVSRFLHDGKRVGAFLSGGLDSSTVTGMLSELSERTAEAYSIGFAADGYDEMAFARVTAKHFGVKLNEYYVTPEDVVQALPKIANSYDEPFGNSSALPAWFCAKLAAENGVEKLLAGDGGDEIFAGNLRYQQQKVFGLYDKLPAGLRSSGLEPLIGKLPGNLFLARKAKRYIEQAKMPMPDRLQSYNFLTMHQPSEIFSEDFLNHINIESPLEVLRSRYWQPDTDSQLDRMLYLDWQFTLADNDLRKVSHMCAMAGIDVCYPFLNDELIAFSLTLPDKWKIRGKNLRYFYKESLKHWLPEQTISKKKQGFGLPFGVWMRTHRPLQEIAYDSLIQLGRRHIVRKDFLDNLIDLHRNNHSHYYGELIWVFMILELWLSGNSLINRNI